MTEKFIAAYIVLLAGLVFARQRIAKAAKVLEPELKAKLLDLALGRKWQQMIPSIIIMILFFANLKWRIISMFLATLLAFILLLGLSFYNIAVHKNVLRNEGFPDEYMREYSIAMWVRQIAFGGFMLMMVWMTAN